MKKTLLLILLVLLIILCIIITQKRGKQSTTLSAEGTRFAVEAQSEIARIEIYQMGKEPVILSKKRGYWTVAKQYPVRKNAIDNLLEVLYGLEIQFIPPSSAWSNIRRDLSAIGVEVKIYNPKNQLLRNYHIGAVTQDERGTYMSMAGAKHPYVTHLPNLEGSVRGRFLMNELDWRDRTMLDKNPESIEKILVDYKKDPGESFVLEKVKGKFDLQPLNQSVFKNPILSNPNLIRDYVAGFDLLVAEYFENENPYRDSISALLPFAEISIDYDDNSNKTMRLFPVEDVIFLDQNTRRLDQTGFIRRYFVDCSWGDFMLVQHRLIGKLLRGYSYFVEE